MNLLMKDTSIALWQDVVKHAEDSCSIVLKEDLEAYLVSMLVRFTTKPEIAKQILASAFWEALNMRENQRIASLQHVGDQCLIFAGFFPRLAEKRHVKLNYFVDLGQSAYGTISREANDLYWSLAMQFVGLMDILQSIRHTPDLLPLEAYEQWESVGSQRALRMLRQYSRAILKNSNFNPNRCSDCVEKASSLK